MKTLSIDLETFGKADLTKSGVYKYAYDPSFEILLFAYSADEGEVKVVDLARGESIPEEVLTALTDDNVIKYSFNASFERICLSSYLGRKLGNFLNPKSWRCTKVWSGYLGLPSSLQSVGEVLGLDKQKMSEGKDLIKYFCVPCKKTNANGGRERNLPKDAPEKWELFKKYNKRDVEAEMEIQERLKKYPLPSFLWDEYHLSEEINDRGILIDMDLVKKAIELDEKSRFELITEMEKLTGLENPNSVQQMKMWLSNNGVETESLDKKAIAELQKDAPKELSRVLTLRSQLAKSSVKKYQAMENAVCSDNRARGMFMFYGANRTGRYSGKIIQLQNLPTNHLTDLAGTREFIKNGEYSAVKEHFEDLPSTLSQLIRTAFIPKENRKFSVADFSAIEARVIAFIAGEKWKSDAFAKGEDIYCSTASRMFNVPVVKNGVNGELRQKGKIAELACGYGGNVGALKAMGALEMGLKEDELSEIVSAWREANPNIVRLWRAVGRASTKAVKEKTTVKTHGLIFTYRNGMLFVILPSGRHIAYVKPRISENRFGSECITYEGIGQTKKWERLETYGPKLTENIVQATARDILCYAMKNLNDNGFEIVMHIHDEAVIEAPKDAKLETVCKIMSKTPPWAEGLVLRADGYECEFYEKQ